jgi:predicted esterase
MNKLSFDELTGQMMELYREGKYADALQVVELNANRFPENSARTTFWRMCLLSLCGRTEEVISVFRQGLESGLWWAERQFSDTDLDAVRHLPEFKHLMDISINKYRQAQESIKPERTVLVPDSYESMLPLLIALHGGGGNKDTNLKEWEVARQRGWLVLSPQSTHSIFPNAYWWADDLDQRLRDIQVHFDEILKKYPIDSTRIVTAGMSQGSGMAIHTALDGRIPVRGFMSIAVGWPNYEELASLAPQAGPVRGYFVIGEKDHTLQSAREIQKILRDNKFAFAEEVYPDLGHEFPPDLERSFDRAIDFIFKEQE